MQQDIFYPMLTLVGLTIAVWIQMYIVRIGTAVREKIPAQAVNPFNKDLPRAIVTSGDNWRNIIEAPTLFYVLCLSTFVLEKVDSIYVVGAWVYVVLRILHSIIHLSYNRIFHRFVVYAVSSIVLWLLWGRLAIQFLA